MATSQISYLQNTTSYMIETIWFTNLTTVDKIGDYDFVLYANDTSNFTASDESWFEVYDPIQMYATKFHL